MAVRNSIPSLSGVPKSAWFMHSSMANFIARLVKVYFFFQSLLLHSSYWVYRGQGRFQKAVIYLNYHVSKDSKENRVALMLFTSAKIFYPQVFPACVHVHRWQVSKLGHSLADISNSDILNLLT